MAKLGPEINEAFCPAASPVMWFLGPSDHLEKVMSPGNLHTETISFYSDWQCRYHSNNNGTEIDSFISTLEDLLQATKGELELQNVEL